MLVVWLALGFLVLLVILFMVQSAVLASVLKWEDAETVGLNYYGRPVAERNAFKRRLRLHAKLLSPILWRNARLIKVDFHKARFQHKGVSGPPGTCSAASFAKAESYGPRPEDVFVATQMKCGTTWMQHVVLQILERGKGDLVETGRSLFAVSPWIEGRKSVPVEQAPLVGKERPTRIIKTHLPAQLCPFSSQARYIYVARHPISCFASCVDFIATNVGGMAPTLAAFEEWYTSPDLMWWGTWTDHVKGWWRVAQQEKVVHFVYFEDMKKDLATSVRGVAEFLGVAPLTEEELTNVVQKCGFSYMQEHQECFEMTPPHILQASAEIFVSGSAERHKDVPEETRARLARWTVQEMADSTFPLVERYPDVAKTGAVAG